MESWAPYIIGAVVALVLLNNFLRSNRRPESSTFSCHRCKKTGTHSQRTINAWRDGKTHFFCNDCHQVWLRNNPSASRRTTRAKSGCMSVLVLFAVVPTIFLIVLFVG